MNPPILTVAQLNRQIRHVLEEDIGEVNVEGEVSTLSKPSSGHTYFTLKDSSAQLRCVFFKNRRTALSDTVLQSGQHIIAKGQLSLYEARGDYQLIVERIESAGLGDLHRQFELLKKKLAALGLFDARRKKALPAYPRVIGVVTSSSGAAYRDILSTLARRYPIAEVVIYPSDVQGRQAPQQLIMALQRANQEGRADVLILARGGGSIEDLWGFNDEGLAYAIAESLIPIVSGVGHETDFTIADFVADFRAATPTAAAEAVSPNQVELLLRITTLETRLLNATRRLVQHQHLLLQHALQKINSPKQLIRSYWQTLDYLKENLLGAAAQRLSQNNQLLQRLTNRLLAISPERRILQDHQRIQILVNQMTNHIQSDYQKHRLRLDTHMATLHAVSPLATLSRGYAIASYNDEVLLQSRHVPNGATIKVTLAEGGLICKVTQHAQ